MMTDGPPDSQRTPGPDLPDGDEALWRLLDRAPRPGPVSPYFSRRVLREVAALEENQPAGQGAPGWLARVWLSWQGQARGVFAGALAAVALLAVGVGVSPLRWGAPSGPVVVPHADTMALAEFTGTDPAAAETTPDDGAGSPSSVAASEPPVAAQDVEVIADLDNLLSHEESRLWTDEDTTARF